MKEENPNSMDRRGRDFSGPAGVARTAGDRPVTDPVTSGQAVPGGGGTGQTPPGQPLSGRASHGTALPDPGVQDHPVLDRSGAMRRLELDAESYGQLLALMTVEVAGMLDALTEAWRNDDAAAMRQHAHRLKSEAANVGAEEVRFAASRLELLLRLREGADGAPRSSTPNAAGPHSLGAHSSGAHSSGPHSSGPHSSGAHSSGAHPSGKHPTGPHLSAPPFFTPDEATAAVSHLRTALARLAAVLGQ
ncbi:hypothetical protein FVW20_13280 [Desulfovibrio oxamicus]|uniref:HPt domain-containing protein n=1 Tax=Nitratidesulfovibrio oxamicus TaxID=32016 RepID=A0ABS0J686_9BACT|nr:Hpt domain-containing protein [Nitratidesulfovibrio oxamicus]MBG3877953.1 hypothetical protein [Nitratidesulfovibrio oxamicus]